MNHLETGADFAGYRRLFAWLKGFEVIDAIYDLVKGLPADERFELSSQMRRAAVSIPSNVAEGYYRSARANVNHLGIALGSTAELDTQLRVCTRRLFVSEQAAAPAFKLLFDQRRLLFGLKSSVERRHHLSADD